MNINSEENGLNSNGDIFIFPSGHYIILGGLEKHYHPIIQKGILKIKGATIFVGGSYEGINASTPQFHSSFIKDFNPGTNIKIYDNEENIYIINMKIRKKLEYIYFSYPGNNATLEINGKRELNKSREMRTLVTLVTSESEKDISTINSKDGINTKDESYYDTNNIRKDSNSEEKDISNNKTNNKEEEINNENNKKMFIKQSYIFLFLMIFDLL